MQKWIVLRKVIMKTEWNWKKWLTLKHCFSCCVKNERKWFKHYINVKQSLISKSRQKLETLHLKGIRGKFRESRGGGNLS